MERIYIDGDMAKFTRKDITTVDVAMQNPAACFLPPTGGSSLPFWMKAEWNWR